MKIKMFNPLMDGDKINWVAMHPVKWGELKRKYGINEKEEDIDLVGFDTQGE